LHAIIILSIGLRTSHSCGLYQTAKDVISPNKLYSLSFWQPHHSFSARR